MSRIIIDLTDLELWGGNHGGTQRVVYGIAKEFYTNQADLEQEVIFASFSSIDNNFHISDFAPILDRVESIQQSPTSSGTTSPQESSKTKIKRIAKKYLPEKVWRDERFRKVALTTIVSAKKVKARGKQRLRSFNTNSSLATREPLAIEATDTVLILGKPWDNPDIQRYLSDQKQRVNYKLVQVVYDLIICLNPHMHHPSLFTVYTQHMFEVMSISDLLLPISESSARDVKVFCERLNLRIPEMKVIRLGDEIKTTQNESQDSRPDPRVKEEFVLCVGTVEIRKNHTLLYYAYRLAHDRGIELPQLVIVGSRGWLTGDFQNLISNDPAVRDKILLLDSINDSGLDWLYSNCRYTVYPTMYEGWGLPVAESLTYGKFCIASSSSSVPEIAGNLIDYISPYDSNACLEALIKYQDKALLKRKEEAINTSFSSTPWRTTFKQVVEHVS